MEGKWSGIPAGALTRMPHRRRVAGNVRGLESVGADWTTAPTAVQHAGSAAGLAV